MRFSKGHCGEFSSHLVLDLERCVLSLLSSWQVDSHPGWLNFSLVFSFFFVDFLLFCSLGGQTSLWLEVLVIVTSFFLRSCRKILAALRGSLCWVSRIFCFTSISFRFVFVYLFRQKF